MPEEHRILRSLLVGLLPITIVTAGAPAWAASSGPSCLAVTSRVPPSALARSVPATAGVSLTPEGATGNGASADPGISEDGRFVAFQSLADDLVADDDNGVQDVFLRDTVTGSTSRVSVSSAGEQATLASSQPAISGNGRFVAFQSPDHTLVPGDTNHAEDVFLWDRVAGTTTRVSVSSTGTEANWPSADAAVSSTGRYVAFVSRASNLVPHDVNHTTDVFVRDMELGSTTRVSVTRGGIQGNDVSADPAISDDGGVIAFHSWASNLVPHDDNGVQDIFVWDRATRSLRRVNVSSSGAEANKRSTDPYISGSGRFVTFGSLATNLVPNDANGAMDQFVYDRNTGRTTIVSLSSREREGNSTSCDATISRGGRYVAFISVATNLVPQDTQGWRNVFVRDRVAGTTRLISVAAGGAPADRESADPRISEDGRYVAFRSAASNLIPSDLNRRTDVFIRGPLR